MDKRVSQKIYLQVEVEEELFGHTSAQFEEEEEEPSLVFHQDSPGFSAVSRN